MEKTPDRPEMPMSSKTRTVPPVLWASLILVVAQAITFYVARREEVFFDDRGIVSPDMSVGPPVLYFLVVSAVIGLVLLLLPLRLLKLVMRAMFAALYAWGLSIVLVVGFAFPFPAGLVLALAAGAAWFFWPTILLHNLLMVLTLVGAGSVFGYLLSPWTFMVFMAVIAVYDFLAVRLGYMLWMAKKLSESDALPAFVLPNTLAGWKRNLKGALARQLSEREPGERDFTILGGGDIGFPLMLSSSLLFAEGIPEAAVVAAFSLLGLLSAYWIQHTFLKGKPMPALPPIAVASFLGLLIARLL